MSLVSKRRRKDDQANSGEEQSKRPRTERDSQDHLTAMVRAIDQSKGVPHPTASEAPNSLHVISTDQRQVEWIRDSDLTNSNASETHTIAEGQGPGLQKVELPLPDMVPQSRTKRTQPMAKKKPDMWYPDDNATPLNAKARIRNAMSKFGEEYLYSDIKDKQVRLLVIDPGKEDDEIKTRLQVVNDENLGTPGYRYEALSYHWGAGKEGDYIIITDEWRSPPTKGFADVVRAAQRVVTSRRLWVRPNLYSALKRLRTPQSAIVLWVDALCINQKDLAEKTGQVKKMNEIYQKAFNVCIWLGPEDPDFHSSKAMAFCREVINVERLQSLLNDDGYISHWASLFQLLKWSWFSRRWVIQELALAQEATVHCGQAQVHWDDFRDAIGIFHRYFKDLEPRLQDLKLGGVSELEPLGANLLVELTSELFRRKSDGSLESTIGLEKLVSRLCTFNTSDPRDTINCLRNICKELNVGKAPRSPSRRKMRKPPPDPDYGQDLFEVYRDFVEWVIEDSESLDIICRHWALKEKSELHIGPGSAPRLAQLPSWILTAEDGPYGAGEAVFRGRKAGASFVGLPGETSYSASGRSLPSVKFAKKRTEKSSSSAPAIPFDTHTNSDQTPHDYSLTVKGHLIGTIGWTSGQIPAGIIPQRGLEKLGWTRSEDDETNTVPDQLCRTLVAGRGPNGTPVPTYYSRACGYCLLNETPNGHINTNELLHNDESTTTQSIVKDYLERVRAVTWNRVILQGTPVPGTPPAVLQDNPISPVLPESLGARDHLVGLGPTNTEINDVIAIFFGCSVPVILRPFGGRRSPVEYKFLGEAYIYGKMDAESMDEGHREEEFVLR